MFLMSWKPALFLVFVIVIFIIWCSTRPYVTQLLVLDLRLESYQVTKRQWFNSKGEKSFLSIIWPSMIHRTTPMNQHGILILAPSKAVNMTRNSLFLYKFNKNIERHTVHTIVSWPNPKQVVLLIRWWYHSVWKQTKINEMLGLGNLLCPSVYPSVVKPGQGLWGNEPMGETCFWHRWTWIEQGLIIWPVS